MNNDGLILVDFLKKINDIADRYDVMSKTEQNEKVSSIMRSKAISYREVAEMLEEEINNKKLGEI